MFWLHGFIFMFNRKGLLRRNKYKPEVSAPIEPELPACLAINKWFNEKRSLNILYITMQVFTIL